MLVAAADVEGVRLQRAARHNRRRRALGHAAQRGDPFGKFIDLRLDYLSNAIEELVQRNEARALDVPVGLLGLQGHVDTVGQPLGQGADELAAQFFGDVDSGLVHDVHLCSGSLRTILRDLAGIVPGLPAGLQ